MSQLVPLIICFRI